MHAVRNDDGVIELDRRSLHPNGTVVVVAVVVVAQRSALSGLKSMDVRVAETGYLYDCSRGKENVFG